MFKVGDVIRLLDDGGCDEVQVGEEYTILDVDIEAMTVCLDTDHGRDCWFDFDFIELAFRKPKPIKRSLPSWF